MREKFFIVLLILIGISSYAVAQERFVMAGAAPSKKGAPPPNDLSSIADPLNDTILTLNKENISEDTDGAKCFAHIGVKTKIHSPSSIFNDFGGVDESYRFINNKFRIQKEKLQEIYLLGSVNLENGRGLPVYCQGLLDRSTAIKAGNYLITFSHDHPWVYVFERITHPPRDTRETLDCRAAQTSVEHLICSNRKLIRLDGDVNVGLLVMRENFSKEISYQDPILIDQLDWSRNVRDKCKTTTCLFSVYQARFNYFKYKLRNVWPDYPQDPSESLPD